MSESAWEQVRAFALRLPYAVEDFPWGEPVVKIDFPQRRRNGLLVGPMFVWLGRPDIPTPAVSVKLTDSYEEAVAAGGATRTTMSGLGHWGWLTVPLENAALEFIPDWIQESYRNVAPKKFLARLRSRQEFPIDRPIIGR